jgi:hypothetical protein
MIINLYLASPLEKSVRAFPTDAYYSLFLINLFSGPKACNDQSTNDNGFARFRIPKENTSVLSGFAQVTSEGEYVQPPHAKLSYGGVSVFFCGLIMSSLTYDDARCFTSVQSKLSSFFASPR